jgi:hypothetical protein
MNQLNIGNSVDTLNPNIRLVFQAQKTLYTVKPFTETINNQINQQLKILDERIDALINEIYGVPEEKWI